MKWSDVKHILIIAIIFVLWLGAFVLLADAWDYVYRLFSIVIPIVYSWVVGTPR